MKQLIPWPIKFCLKLVIGITGVDYRVLKRVHIVEHGRMEHADFSVDVFNRHVDIPSEKLHVARDGVLLELGPGDSIATGVLGLAAGFSEVILIDVGCFADLTAKAVNNLFAILGRQPAPVQQDASAPEAIAQLAARGIRYLTDGLQSLQSVGTGQVRHSFSNSVLQHVYRDELADLVVALGRAHAPGSISSHSINFTDHFSGGYVNHVLPEWVMESALIKRANLYTNRVSPEDFSDLFAAAGFAIRKVAVDFVGHEHCGHCEYDCATDFKVGVAGRRVLRAVFLLQKNPRFPAFCVAGLVDNP